MTQCRQAPEPAPVRHLPGHIAAALAGAGGATDSAGQPWAGRSLSGDAAKIHNFEDDDGTADAGYLAAVADLAAGTGDEAAVVAALATARVFVPIVAQLAEEGEAVTRPTGTSPTGIELHSDKQADMALVTLKAPDGRTAMPVFTSAASLKAWHQEARPVAVYAARAALSAVAEGAELLVLDPGSEADVRGAPAGGLGPRPAAALDAVVRRSGSRRCPRGQRGWLSGGPPC